MWFLEYLFTKVGRRLKVFGLLAAFVLCIASGLYDLRLGATPMQTEQEENNRLRLVNEQQRQHLLGLEKRMNAVEDASHLLADMWWSRNKDEGTEPHDAVSLADVEARAAEIEAFLKSYYEAASRARVPPTWVAEGEASESFGCGSSESHPGKEIAAPHGTPVIAPADGKVIEAGCRIGYGRMVLLDHGNGLTTRYGHLSKIEVTQGQEVRRGGILGLVGSTDRSTGPHLHYEVRIEDLPVSPEHYLPGR